MHVRHGDKSVDMRLVPGSEFFAAAERLVKVNNRNGYARGGFISTEDPAVLEEARKLSGSSAEPGSPLASWAWTWVDVPRDNSNGATQLAKFKDALPAGKLTRIWLLNLLIALECDAWLGTLGSNWNRLIDELRCVWLPKCTQPYNELGSDDRLEGYTHNWL